MKKRLRCGALGAVLLTAMLVVLSACAPGGSGASGTTAAAGYTERSLDVISVVDGAPTELSVRFYDDAPNVPYFGLSQYKEVVIGDKTTVESDGKVATLTATDGGSVTVDDAKDTLSSDNIAAFRTYLAPQQQAGSPAGMLDLGTPFVRVGSIECEGPAQPMTLDYGAYDIDLRVDEKDAYLPLACESDLLACASGAALFYNGTNLYLTDAFFDDVRTLDPDYYQQLEVNHERPQDMVDFAYNNLCFLMDNLAGIAGSAALDDLITQKGFDGALDYDDATRKMRELLKSTDFYEYLAGTEYLYNLTTDTHTELCDAYFLLQSSSYLESELVQDATVFQALYETDLTSSHYERMDSDDDSSIPAQRAAILGENPPTYREEGNTAVIILDSFLDYDAAGWDAYYREGADMPTDSDIVGTLIAGLGQAKANPQITNVVLDVSCNSGGYNDLLAMVDALVHKQPQLRLYDKLIQQFSVVNYEVDSLLDGSFNIGAFADETDFAYAVLTSRRTFSCGNAFAEHCRDAGIPILGEPTLGGEYMVVPTFFPEGLCARVSAGSLKMVDASGSGNETGVPVDVELVKANGDGTFDYSDFYDTAKLNEVMNALNDRG